MSQDESPSLPTKVYRTVTPGSHRRPDGEMDSIGWSIFLIMAVLLVPLLPFVVIVYAVSKVLDFLAASRGREA